MMNRVWSALRGPWVPPSMGRAPYVWVLALLFMGWKFFYVAPGALELALLALTVLVFLPVYFVSMWRNNGAVLPYVLFMFALGMAWAPWNAGASNFFIFAAARCAGFERRVFAYLGLLLIILSACLIAPFVSNTLSFLLPVLFFGGPVGVATILEDSLRRSREDLLRKQEEVVHMSRIAERERISRDLHDLLGHTLSMITLKAELAGKLLERDPLACRSEIADIERTARQALGEVRAAVSGMRQTGFAHELAAARASLAAAGVDLSAQVQPCALPPALENVLSLALREAVTNILRHAGASECRVAMALEAGMVVLRVSDNGSARGGGAGLACGNGLTGMKERALALGGKLALRAERGLALELSLPLGAHA
jgi:two-component system sensor histidine kinase DesK